jgi:hypothetical protein
MSRDVASRVAKIIVRVDGPLFRPCQFGNSFVLRTGLRNCRTGPSARGRLQLRRLPENAQFEGQPEETHGHPLRAEAVALPALRRDVQPRQGLQDSQHAEAFRRKAAHVQG